MVNLKALEAAINRVENVRHHEFTFEVSGQAITIRILKPEEESEVQKYAQIALESVDPDGPPDQGAYMDLMNRMRQATLGHAIVQLGDIDLRGVEFLQTGEHDDNGIPISVPKWEAITNMVAEWSQQMLSEVSKKYGDLVDRVDIHADKVVKYDPVDLDTEIERVEKRLKDLREAKSKRDGAATGGPVPQAQSGEINTRPTPQAQPQAQPRSQQSSPPPSQPQPPPSQPQPPQQQPQAPQSPQGRQSAVPQAAPPPQRAPQQEAAQEPQEGQPQQFVDEQGILLPDGGDSFFDPSDPGQAMEIEARRQAMLHQQHLARQRAKAQEEQMRREMGIPSAQEHARQMAEGQRQASRPNAVDLSKPAGGAAAGVRQAANLHNAVFDPQTNSVQPGRPQRAQPQPGGAGKPAELHGKPVFKMPAQTLDRPEAPKRKHGEPAPGPVQMNPSAGGRNPNFRPKGS